MNKKDLLSFFFDHNNQFYWLHSPTGIILESSDSISRITGYTSEQMLNKSAYDYFHPDDAEYIQNQAHIPVLKGKVIDVEYRFKKADGNYTWMHTDGFPVFDELGQIKNIFSITTPINDIVNYRQEVQRNEKLMNQAERLAGIGAWELNLLTLKLTWSKATYAIFEVSDDFEPDFENAVAFFSEEYQSAIRDKLKTILEHKNTTVDIVAELITAKGTRKWVRLIGEPELLYGKPVKIFGSFHDITNEIKAKQSLEETVAHLTTQKKQLLEFNQIVSHNLRAPVGNFSMLLSMLADEDDENEKFLLINSLSEVSHSLHTLLNDLVDVVKISTNTDIEHEKVNLKTILEQTKVFLRGDIINLNAEIETDFEWHEVIYPKIYMESIFLNMLSNSLKYAALTRAPKIKISSSYNENNRKALIFSDNGSGIDMERNAHKVFKLHKTFHKDKQGKGLGLFMTKNQVEAIGGQIEVESELDKGTKFTITIKNN